MLRTHTTNATLFVVMHRQSLLLLSKCIPSSSSSSTTRKFARFTRAIPQQQSSSNTDNGESIGGENIVEHESVGGVDHDQQKRKQFNYLGICESTDVELIQGQYVVSPSAVAKNSTEDNNNNVKTRVDVLLNKYEALLDTRKSPSLAKEKLTWFGKIRLDSDNVPRYHGQFESDQSTTVADSIQNITQKMAQCGAVNDVLLSSIKRNDHQQQPKSSSSSIPLKPIEGIEPNLSSDSINLTSLAGAKIRFRYTPDFMSALYGQTSPVSSDTTTTTTTSKSSNSHDNDNQQQQQQSVKVKGALQALMEKLQEQELPLSERIRKVSLRMIKDEIRKEVVAQDSLATNSPTAKPVEEITGEEYLKQIYAGKRTAHFQSEYDQLKSFLNTKQEHLDSKGYRILKNQVPDYSKLTNAEVVQLLHRSVLFNDADIVALNKPYGIAVHGAVASDDGGENKGLKSTKRIAAKFDSALNLQYFLPQLAPRVGAERLYPIHRLDRDTTGVLILAKTQAKAAQLHQLFNSRSVAKKYLCITKCVPDPREGIIDIPIELGYICTAKNVKRERMILCPEPLEDIRATRRPPRSAKRAITRYRVLCEEGNAALLSVEPETGVRHQIRVHLGFGLRCPILGDHKYSSLDSLAPQKLSYDLLKALRVRQAKVRHVPMHLHAYQYMLPQAGSDGRNVFILAPLPYHFRKNMSSLGLKL